MSATVTFSYDYMLRNTYQTNRQARISSSRDSMKKTDLMKADSDAIQNIKKQLKELEYDSNHVPDILQTVKGFIETYNNLIDSTTDAGTHALKSLHSKIKENTKEHSSQLASLGITVTSSGQLKFDKTKFGEATVSKIESFFGKDESGFFDNLTEYAKKVDRYAKRAATQTILPPKKKKAVTQDQMLVQALTQEEQQKNINYLA